MTISRKDYTLILIGPTSGELISELKGLLKIFQQFQIDFSLRIIFG
jgi:hypothetical protein